MFATIHAYIQAHKKAKRQASIQAHERTYKRKSKQANNRPPTCTLNTQAFFSTSFSFSFLMLILFFFFFFSHPHISFSFSANKQHHLSHTDSHPQEGSDFPHSPRTGRTTTLGIKKELSICQSLPCLDLVSFPVLSQIKPQAPLLVVPFRQFL